MNNSSSSDAQDQKRKHRKGDGIGAVKDPVEARPGYRDRRVLIVLVISLTLISAAYAIIYFWR
jgi:hypothetical protein